MGLLELCEKYYGTTNLYEVLQINEKATDKEVKKAYHKLSLKVHPDRVSEDEKLEATEKFKVLGSIHEILTDQNKRTIYDETKTVDDDDYHIIVDRDWTVYWRLLFKKITDEDIKAYEQTYKGSDEEKQDIKQAYLDGKGDMDIICDRVQFARSDQEPRIREIVNEMIKNGDVPAYKIFTHEPVKKRQKRLAKENREAKEAEEMKAELGLGTGINSRYRILGDSAKEMAFFRVVDYDSARFELNRFCSISCSGPNSLEFLIKKKQESRAHHIDSFIDDLAAKYGGGSKTKGKKRKAPGNSEPPTKNKRKK